MRNPFEDLFKQRRRFQKRVQIERRERDQVEQLDSTRFEARLQEKQRYDEMVNRLLTQFIQAFDPMLQLYTYNNGWSVGRWDKHDDNSLRWYSVLDVQMVYEKNDKALYFELVRHRTKVRSALGHEELALAIRGLFPPRG